MAAVLPGKSRYPISNTLVSQASLWGCGRKGRTDISVKTEFKPRVTLWRILSEQNLELLKGQFYTSTTLMYWNSCLCA